MVNTQGAKGTISKDNKHIQSYNLKFLNWLFELINMLFKRCKLMEQVFMNLKFKTNFYPNKSYVSYVIQG